MNPSTDTVPTSANETSSNELQLHSLFDADIAVSHDLETTRGSSSQRKMLQNKQNQQNYQNN